MEIVAARAIEDDAEFVDKSKVAAIADEGDGRAFGDVDADAIGQDALHTGGLHPGNLFDFTASGVERNAENASATIFVERSEYRFSRDDMVAGDFDLLGFAQKNFGRVEQKISGDVTDNSEIGSNHGSNKNSP